MPRIPILLMMMMLTLLMAGCGRAPQAVQTASSMAPTQIASVAPLSPAETPDLPESTPVLRPSPTLAPPPPPSPTLVPVAVEQPAPPPQPTEPPAVGSLSVISEPTAGASVASPITVHGSTTFWPFQTNLLGQVKDAAGNLLGAAVTAGAPNIGPGGPFDGQLPFTAPASDQEGTIEVIEQRARDGSILTIQTVNVRLQALPALKPPAPGIRVDAPRQGEGVTLPLHIALRGAQPNEHLLARLRFASGTILEERFAVVGGMDGVGYAVLNLNWTTESAPPRFGHGPATLEIVQADGTVLKSVGVTILPNESTQWVQVAWAATGDGDDLIPFRQRVPKTPQIASAALRELVRGPQEGNPAGAVSAFPTTHEIVTFPGRQSDWGYEVQVLKLTITDGVATATFSEELRASGGGSERVRLIRLQVEQTLRQFPSVREVIIQIER